jgi:hypothetical protein
MRIIRSFDSLDADVLSALLGYTIADFHIRGIDTINSRAARVDLVYSEKAEDAPHSIFIKLNWEGEGEYEHRFYQQEKGDYFPRCYANAFDKATGDSHLILQDLSQTHHAPVSREALIELRAVPPIHDMERIIDAVAQMHSNHWEDKAEWAIPHYFESAEGFARRMQKYQDDWAAFKAKGFEIPKNWHGYYEQSLEVLPVLWETHFAPRFESHRQLTLIHGDCYLSQFLINGDSVYMADFDSVGFSLPTDDLIYLMVNFWTRQQRAEHEQAMLRRYLYTLNQANYRWENLVEDYRAMLHFRIFHAVWDAVVGSSELYWRNKMTCLIEAYEDWTQ